MDTEKCEGLKFRIDALGYFIRDAARNRNLAALLLNIRMFYL